MTTFNFIFWCVNILIAVVNGILAQHNLRVSRRNYLAAVINHQVAIELTKLSVYDQETDRPVSSLETD